MLLDDDIESFTALEQINTVAAISSDVTLEQMKRNVKRQHKRLHQLPEFKVLKKEPIALIGGGPSLVGQLDELRKFKNTMACGSAHDYIVKQGITPKYTTICDPDAISANYITNAPISTRYLVSTGCHNKVYDVLEGHDIYMWHCYSDDYLRVQKEIESDFQAVGGGCTVGLRSLSIALMLGYSDIHFFGFDSCLGEGSKPHAYDATDPENEQLGQIYHVRLGYDKVMNKSKIFYCAGYQLAQCAHFKDFYIRYNDMFEPTFHGEGLLAESMRIINAEREKLCKARGTTLVDEIQNNRIKRLEKLQGALNSPKGTTI